MYFLLKFLSDPVQTLVVTYVDVITDASMLVVTINVYVRVDAFSYSANTSTLVFSRRLSITISEIFQTVHDGDKLHRALQFFLYPSWGDLGRMSQRYRKDENNSSQPI